MRKGTIDAAGQTDIGDAAGGSVSRWAIQFTVPSAFSGSVTIKGRVRGSGNDPVAIAYVDFADGTTKTAAITGAALLLVDASGLDVELDCTAYTSGELQYDALPLIG